MPDALATPWGIREVGLALSDGAGPVVSKLSVAGKATVASGVPFLRALGDLGETAMRVACEIPQDDDDTCEAGRVACTAVVAGGAVVAWLGAVAFLHLQHAGGPAPPGAAPALSGASE
eukprot:gene7144-3314_t